MTRPTLAIVVVDDLVDAGRIDLCGRSALDWQLDTIEALAPDRLTVSGAAAADRAALGRALTTDRCCSTTLVLPSSAPLLCPPTLRRVVESLSAGDGEAAQAVVASLERQSPWWDDEQAGASPPVVLAVRGPDGPSAAELGAIHRSAVAGLAPARRALAAAGVPARTTTILGRQALWLNDADDRAAARSALYGRIAAGWLARGVVIEDPATTRIDASVIVGEGAWIGPHTELIGGTRIGRGSRIGPTTTIRNCVVGDGSQVQYSVCQDTTIGDGANIGPFAWVRSGTHLGARCRVGAFVEVSDSVVGDGTEIPHLAGLFSADVGRGCNIASMAGSLNFNGGQKQRVRIGDEVSVGSGSLLIGPVSIGDRAETAAGSVITDDVPDGALAMARAPQRNLAGWSAIRARRGH
jgi:acetyltransferase-like isoleucine patch superfamily enzyme